MEEKKTLIISYLPRKQRSHTKKLLDQFLELSPKEGVEILDLLTNVPPLFLEDSLNLYIKRNYLGETLLPQEGEILKPMDDYVKQLKASDFVVVATPMYNFSVPAAVKAYFDSVLQKGETWGIGENGYQGLMKGKKALILLASGGVYEGEGASMDHAASLLKLYFNFMGFDEVKCVHVAGVNMYKDKLDEIVSAKQKEVSEIVKEWYKK